MSFLPLSSRVRYPPPGLVLSEEEDTTRAEHVQDLPSFSEYITIRAETALAERLAKFVGREGIIYQAQLASPGSSRVSYAVCFPEYATVVTQLTAEELTLVEPSTLQAHQLLGETVRFDFYAPDWEEYYLMSGKDMARYDHQLAQVVHASFIPVPGDGEAHFRLYFPDEDASFYGIYFTASDFR